MLSKELIRSHLKDTHGVLTTKGALVGRESYSGRSVIAPNSRPENADARGYLPVERWIMSTVESTSRQAHPGEGLTHIEISGEHGTLRDAALVAEDILFGDSYARWPLAKILDIGGDPVESSFGTREVPPGAVEVHRGVVVDGHATGPGKVEAYFYPPTCESHGIEIQGAVLRAGFKPGVTKDDVERALKQFGLDDSMYELLNVYPVKPMTGWTIYPGTVHSAAAYVTFEVQAPQDGYNAATWKFGKRLSGEERERAFVSKVLKGLTDARAYVTELIDWGRSQDPDFKTKYQRVPELLEKGDGVRRYRVFFDCFYGEGWEVGPGHELVLPAKHVPQAGVVWSGAGSVNGNALSREGHDEFLAVPGTPVVVRNSGNTPFIIYTVEPMQ